MFWENMKFNLKYKKIILFTPLILISLTIIILSSQSQIQVPDFGLTIEDKIVHFFIFTCYGLCTELALSSFGLKKKPIIILTIIIGLFFGASDEIHQSFVPGRDCSIFDWFADCLGILTSLFFIKHIQNIIRKVF